MRRWNGWGDDALDYPLPDHAARFLTELVGPGLPPQDAQLEKLLAQTPASRLPSHPLVVTEPLDRLQHARGQSLPDWVALHSGRGLTFPDGVAYPTLDSQVAELIVYATAVGAHLIPYGGGTSVVGHINPLEGEVPVLTVDLSRLNQLRQFDETSLLADFGAGVSGPDVEAQLRARGCTLGHFPQSFEYSTLGGWVATRSCGQQSLHYGRIETLFAGGVLESPVGHLVLPSYPASAAGPDLRELLLGSEGRLGVLTEVTVRASPLPERDDFYAIFFPDFESGMVAVRSILQAGLPLSMLRLSTAIETATTLALAGHEMLISALERLLGLRGLGEGKCMLLMAVTGTAALSRTARAQALDLANKQGGVYIGKTFGDQWRKSRFRTPYLRNTLWECGYAVDTLETALSWSGVPALLEAVEAALRQGLVDVGERVHVFTHLSQVYPSGSSVYFTYLFRLSPDPDETLRRWRLLKSAASQAIVAHGGTISHQHGVGLDHLPYLEAEKGVLGMQALHDLCRTFDPHGVMNPGKLVV